MVFVDFWKFLNYLVLSAYESLGEFILVGSLKQAEMLYAMRAHQMSLCIWIPLQQ